MMQKLSATDAITPAWQHVRRLLPDLRDWRLLLKLSAVAFFAQLGGCNSARFNQRSGAGTGSHAGFSHAALLALAIASVVVLALGLLLFYLSSRLQFVLFDVVLRQQTRIAPAWRRYGAVTWRWMGLKLLYFLCAVLVSLPILVPGVVHFVRGLPAGAEQPGVGFVFAILGLIGALFVVLLLAGVGYILLSSFGLPSLALEDVPLREAVARIVLHVRQEPGQVALYVLMRFVLALAGAAVCYVCLLFLALVLVVVLGGAAALLWIALHHGGMGSHVAMIAGWVLLGAVALVVLGIGVMISFGYLYLFLQAYTLYFLGGRYPLLGALLEPGSGGPFTPPPPFPSRRDDADDGPSLPMNPALA